MSLHPFLIVLPFLVPVAQIAVCVTAEVSSAQTGPQKWPDQAQLKRQFQQCHLSKPPEGIPANEAHAATLDYERQCYRQLTEIEHAKLTALQDAAISSDRAQKMQDQTVKEREPFPQCQLSKPPEGVPAEEARIATLDYENQCYRQLAEIERGKLDALQEIAPAKLTHRFHHRRATGLQVFMTYFQATRGGD